MDCDIDTSGDPAPARSTSDDVPGSKFIFVHAYIYFADSLEGGPRYRLTIDDEEFLVGKPIAFARDVFGPSTKAYVAYHKRSRSLVLLKESWRWAYDGFRLEGNVFTDLNAAHVRNVPTLLCHAYVDQQAPRLIPDVCPGQDDEQAQCFPHLPHYRITVSLPHTAFMSSRGLVSIIADCFNTHYEAVTKCQTMHRDVSSHNVLFSSRPRSRGRRTRTVCMVRFRSTGVASSGSQTGRFKANSQ
ncbi:hypothetical protein LXA43DRAFT_879262 [Ganoderma leucocontextum]|nr:hypothetical protein LXA43DRAFT_879262 [Ganoderma leucocontextum]